MWVRGGEGFEGEVEVGAKELSHVRGCVEVDNVIP